MSEENPDPQKDEVEALCAIYGKDMTLQDGKILDLRICCDERKWWAVTISMLLPPNYPVSDPPVFEIHTECLSSEELQHIYDQLNILWEENRGNSIIYIWVEKIREMLFEKYESAKLFIESSEEEKERERSLTTLMREEPEVQVKEIQVDKTDQILSSDKVPEIMSGETITLKKSTFQAHVALVHTVDEVKCVLRKLKENRKVSQATHNIVAYRLSGVNETSFIQDCADDGEVHAGGRLLRLLQIMNVKDIVVIVTRWYGGILLGPDRFRLINNCARDVIVASGAYVAKHEKTKHRKK